MLEFLNRTLDQWGYWVVFALVFLETSAMVGLVVPGETVLLLAAALAAQGKLHLFDLMAIAMVAAILGDTVGYTLGRKLGREFILRHQGIFRIKRHHLDRADRFFAGHGGKTVFLGRWVGFLRSLAPFLAGSARMDYGRFIAYNIAGAVTWVGIVTLLGYAFGRSYRLVEKWLGRISLFLSLAALLAVAFWFLGRLLYKRREALGGLATGLADGVLSWRPVKAFRRRFVSQLEWLQARFSPRSAYGLGLTLGLALSALFAWLLGITIQDVVDHDPLTVFDRTVATVLHNHEIPALTVAIKIITYLGGGWVVAPAAILISVALFMRGHRRDGLVLLTAAAGAFLLSSVLKLMIQRPRPDFLVPLVKVGGYSFPSGHATVAMAFYLTLALLAAGWVRRWETRVYILLGGLFVIFLVGLSRLYLEVHFLSDVLGGYALGALWTTICITGATVFVRAGRGRQARGRGGGIAEGPDSHDGTGRPVHGG